MDDSNNFITFNMGSIRSESILQQFKSSITNILTSKTLWIIAGTAMSTVLLYKIYGKFQHVELTSS